MRPCVSVIVPVYNTEKYLTRCMESLLNQSLKNIEIILVDDQSPDKSPQICDYYAKQDKRVKVIHKTNAGLGFARNSGLKNASGEYVAFLDSDDYVDTNMYQILYDTAKRYGADTVISGLNKVSTDGTVIRHQEVDVMEIFEGDATKSLVLSMLGTLPEERKDFRFEMSACKGIYSSEIIRKNQIAFLSERDVISEDIIYHIEYMEYASKAIVIPECFLYYYNNRASLTKSYRRDRYEQDKLLYYKVCALLREKGYDSFQLYTERMLLARIRVFAGQIVKQMPLEGYDKMKMEMQMIVSDEEFMRICREYPVYRLPVQHKIFIYFLKMKAFRIVHFLVWLNNKRKFF